jgi:RNA binding exosome subunit
MSMTRRLSIVLGVIATTFVLAARAQERLPVKVDPRGKSDVKRSEDKTDPKIKIGDAANQQERLSGQFLEFKQKLLRLMHTMENSTKPEDREKAKVLRKAIEKASEGGIETRFATLIEMLRGGNTSNNTEQLQDILNENKELRQILNEIIELLKKDDRDAELKREIAAARRLLEELKAVIRKQELVLNKTILPRTKNADLAKSQHNVKEQTHDLTNPKSDRGKEPKQGEGKDSKSGKQGMGEGKNDTKDPKADSKDGKDGKSSGNKDGKEGEGKGGQGGKSSESKDGKPGDKKDNKPEAAKPSGNQPKDSKPGDGKGKGQGKGEGKGGQGQSGQGKAGEGKGGGQGGQQGQQGQSEGKEDKKKGGQQQQQQQSSQEQSQIKKQIQDAEKYQERAEDNLRKDNRKDAPDDEQAALDKLNQAKKALEDLLRQLREEEIERLLARLEQRCRRMLALQIGVRDDTVALDKVITSNPDGKATRADQQASLVLSDREEEIVKEARAGLRLLEEEGSAVAFAEVFAQVKGDMELVAARLRKTDTGVVTVTIEDQIIDTLKEMIEALKKAQSKGKSQGGGGGGMPAPQPLLDMLAELKMIRSMQKRINARTDLYGKQYAGEQAPSPEQGSTPDEREKYDRIQGELKDLSKRQQKTAKVTHDLATGKNDHK